MKILIATDTYYPDVNGASYFTQRLAFYLQARGHAILVAAPSRTFRHEFSSHDGVTILGIRSMSVLRYKNFRFSPPFLIKPRVRRAVREFAPDVIHAQGHFFVERTAMAVGHELKIPIIATNHFMPENLVHYFPLPRSMEPVMRRWAWRDFCGVFKHAQIVTTPTRTAAELLKDNGLTQAILPLSCGIDLKKFHPNNPGGELRTRYALPHHNILLYVGRLDREKHLDLILSAFTRLPESLPVHFVIAGTGAEEQPIKQLAHTLRLTNRVTFTGFIPDDELPALYCLADCFMIAGTAELQSLVTMEAMASGLPVIAAQAMALPELVRHGQNGLLFQPGDVQGLADQIQAMFSDASRRKAMAAKSLEFIAPHAIENILNRFESLYQDAIAL